MCLVERKATYRALGTEPVLVNLFFLVPSVAMDVTLGVATLMLGLLLLAYLYVTRHFVYWTKRGVPGPKPTPLFGNFKNVLFQKVSAGDFLRDIYKATAGSPYAGFFILNK